MTIADMQLTHRNPGRWIASLAAAVLCFLATVSAHAQVALELEPEDIGLAGMVRPGSWTPLRVTLDNQAPTPVPVICQWELTDADGEQVIAQRKVTLTPQRKQTVTLYANLPGRTNEKTVWRLQIIEAESGKSLASRLIEGRSLIKILNPNDRLVGVTGPGAVGLQRYKEPYTAHERIELVQGLKPHRLPDRWYGMSAIQILIWTPDSGDPASPSIHPETHAALREWVRRGGHLVISLPIAGDLWSTSPLKDLVPPVRMTTMTDTWAPAWLGDGLPDSMRHFDYKAFEVKTEAAGRVTILRRDNEDRPVIVAWPFGLGRVTLIGVDLSDPRLTREGLPGGRYTIWNQILGWRGEVLPDERIKQLLTDRLMLEPGSRNYRLLDNQVIGPMIDMLEVAGAPLLIAIVFFGAYWLLAGPVGFAVLKRRGLVRHAWVGFTAVVLLASVIAWIGGYLLRPSGTRIRHLSAMTVDTASGWVHVHSWLSLYAPTHGLYEVAIDPAASEGLHNVLAAPGQPANTSVFIDSQRYTVDALQPDVALLPFRATAKQLEADYLGRGTAEAPLPAALGALPEVKFREENFLPVGRAVNKLPGAVTDVIVVYCPSDGREPMVTATREWPKNNDDKKQWAWEPGMPLEIQPGRPWNRLVRAPEDRYGLWTGYLGEHIRNNTGQTIDDLNPNQKRPVERPDQVRVLEILSFFDTLPPPKYAYKKPEEFWQDATKVAAFHRGSTRHMDLTRSLLPGRLIIIGHLEEQDMPLPLKVDDRTVPSKGWTVVRWIVPVE